MAQSPDPARVHRVTLDAKGTELASKALYEATGPLTLKAYLLYFDEIPRPPVSYPASIGFGIFPGPGLDLVPVLTVTAAATEIQYPNYPIQGTARFLTTHVGYEQPETAISTWPPNYNQALELGCTIEGQPDLPLRLGFMVTFGIRPQPASAAESLQSSAPLVRRAAYRVAERQPPMAEALKDLTSRPLGLTERLLHAKSAGGGFLAEDQISRGIFGPFSVTNVLFCSVNENQWVRPGFNTLMIDLQELGIGTVWTVNADVSELAPPASPRTGRASFWTLGAQLDHRSQRAFVYCYLEWDAALPAAVMMTIGYA
jgi:hypothetical protein